MADMAEVLEHVARPNLPWRDDTLTECGKTTDGRVVITREQLLAKIRKQGQARAALSTCMTCTQTATRWQDWATAPSDVMRRNVPSWWGASQRHPIAVRMDAELRAIAALIEAHREEFDGFLAGLEDAADLGARRQRRRIRQAHDARGRF